MNASSPIRILLVDDHLIVRRGLASLIEDDQFLTVIAEAGTGASAIAAFNETEPDVCILDLRLPDISGIELANQILSEYPEAKLLVLSSFQLEEDVQQVFQLGILGYVAKDASSSDLLDAIHTVAAGNQFISPQISLVLAKATGSASLSDRELEILKLIADGRANKEIGAVLSVAENTVKNHVKSILAKLQARDRTHAVSEALRRGLIKLG